MNANDYQELAARTLIDKPDREYTPTELLLMWHLVGLIAESGEIADIFKKGIFHQHGYDPELISIAIRNLNFHSQAIQHIMDNTHSPKALELVALSPVEIMHIWNLSGIAGEGGEVAKLIQVMMVTHEPIDAEAMKDELSDCQWYVSAEVTRTGLKLADVMQFNIEKLRKRYEHGYSSEASKQRVDVQGETNESD